MSSVMVINNQFDAQLMIVIEIVSETRKTSINLNRLKSEALYSTLERLHLNLIKKRKIKGQQNLKHGIQSKQKHQMYIAHEGIRFDFSMANEKAWIEGAKLYIEDEEIEILVNPPSVKLDCLPSVILQGFPLFPHPDFAFADEQISTFHWKTSTLSDLEQLKNILTDCRSSSCSCYASHLSDTVNSKYYIPSKEDIGKYVFLACCPQNGNRLGKIDVVISQYPILDTPESFPFERRHNYTKDMTHNKKFRVVSYNILADMYSNSDYAKNELFSYCPAHALTMNYRKHLLLKEIIGYHGDLVSLQEVDHSVFHSHLKPALNSLGYTCLYRPKGRGAGEGCASFIKDNKFRVVEQVDTSLSEYLSSHPDCTDIWADVLKVPLLSERLEQRSSILQVTVVESVEEPGHYVCLCNTHLYFRPNACHIRLIHAAVALRYIQRVCLRYHTQGSSVAMVFCGDFNSSPRLGVYQLFTTGKIPANHPDWESAGPLEQISLSLQQSMKISSACGTPAYTNYSPNFHATLDYVFIDSDKLALEEVVPMPEHNDVIANVGLPSVVFPSDHLALVCDLSFKPG